MKNTFRAFMQEEKGGIAENTALVVMILVIVVGVVTAISAKVKNTSSAAGPRLDSASNFSF